MKGFFIKLILGLVLITALIFTVNYYYPFSEGVRAGELVKFSKKGVIFKTWEGEISSGVSESTRFFFSVEKKNKEVIDKLFDVQGKSVKLSYKERFFTFPWMSDTKYFIEKVEVVDYVPSVVE